MEPQSRCKAQHPAHRGHHVAELGEQLTPAQLRLAEALVEEERDAPQVAAGVGDVDEDLGGGYGTDGGDEPVEQDAVDWDVAQVEAGAYADHPQRRAEEPGLARGASTPRPAQRAGEQHPVDHQ